MEKIDKRTSISDRRPDQIIKTKCPCCGREAEMKIFKAKWQGEYDQARVNHKVWSEKCT